MQLSWLVTGPTGLLTLLLLQDKKRRQYLITALADTKVDYKGEGVAFYTPTTRLPPSTHTLTHHSPAPRSPTLCMQFCQRGWGWARAGCSRAVRSCWWRRCRWVAAAWQVGGGVCVGCVYVAAAAS